MLCIGAQYTTHVIDCPFPEIRARVGSADDNDLIVPFPAVAAYHAIVERSAGGFCLIGVASRRVLVGDRVSEP